MFQKKSIVITLILTLVLVFSFAITSFAYEKNAVEIDDKEVLSGSYMDNSGTVHVGEPSSDGYAYYKDGVLTLNNFSITSGAFVIISLYSDLEINLIGENSIISSETDLGAGAACIRDFPHNGVNIMITGDGKLFISAKTAGIATGIYTNGNLTVKKATLEIESLTSAATGENIVLENANISIKSCNKAITYYENFNIDGGYLKIEGNLAIIKKGDSNPIIENATPIRYGDTWDNLTEVKTLEDTSVLLDKKCIEIGVDPNKEPENPKTADTNNILFWIILGAGAIVATYTITKKIRQK